MAVSATRPTPKQQRAAARGNKPIQPAHHSPPNAAAASTAASHLTHQQWAEATTGATAAAHPQPTSQQASHLPTQQPPPTAAAAGGAQPPHQTNRQTATRQSRTPTQAGATNAAAANTHAGGATPGADQPTSRRYMERGGYYAAPYNPETDPWHEGEDDPSQAQITASDLASRFGYPWYDAQGNLVLPSPAVPGSSHWRAAPPTQTGGATPSHDTQPTGGATSTQQNPQQQRDTPGTHGQPPQAPAGTTPTGQPQSRQPRTTRQQVTATAPTAENTAIVPNWFCSQKARRGGGGG